ncbi:MAG: tRNA preQ1(34) S-adenosylmethionine ribosyltransferase-isomerase QueA [Pseudomonadota bacterium]
MDVDEFDFVLPERNIALRPAIPRDSAKLLRVDAALKGSAGAFSHFSVSDLPNLLNPEDVLVLNDTRVLPAHVSGERRRGDSIAQFSATLHQRTAGNHWLAFVRGAKKLRVGDDVRFFGGALGATVSQKREDGSVGFTFDRGGAELDAALYAHGDMPLPPYIASKRPTDARDEQDYQTVYANEAGAVAAPTAGLHFTEQLFDALNARGIQRHFVTLHVGAGTFLPVKADDTDDHQMHFETGSISQETADALNLARERGGRIIAVGTTSVRVLESAAQDDGTLAAWHEDTDIFIQPGYRFKAVDGLMTNFHLPRSTLFMLVSALCGLETMQKAYAHAIENDYRFYSYGDSSLLFPN